MQISPLSDFILIFFVQVRYALTLLSLFAQIIFIVNQEMKPMHTTIKIAVVSVLALFSIAGLVSISKAYASVLSDRELSELSQKYSKCTNKIYRHDCFDNYESEN